MVASCELVSIWTSSRLARGLRILMLRRLPVAKRTTTETTMTHSPPKLLFSGIALVATLACGSGGDLEPVAEFVQALNTCEEAVPANRQVDGIPAYAQCEATTNSSIWSNNGIDTSTTSLGPDWIRTQQGGGYQCTELARRYMRFRWQIDYQNGNAGSWCEGRLPSTLVKSTTPVHGDLIVFAPGSCGASTDTGHIAVVDTVDASAAKVTLVEENRAGRRSANQSCAACFLHAVANDGSSAGSGGAPSGGGGVSGAAGDPSTGGAVRGGAAGTANVPAQGGSAGSSDVSASGGTTPSSAGTTATSGSSASGYGAAWPTAGAQSTTSTGGAGPIPPSAAGTASARGPSGEGPASCAVAGAPGTTASRSGLVWLGALLTSALLKRRRRL
jgi:hypothetical protein